MDNLNRNIPLHFGNQEPATKNCLWVKAAMNDNLGFYQWNGNGWILSAIEAEKLFINGQANFKDSEYHNGQEYHYGIEYHDGQEEYHSGSEYHDGYEYHGGSENHQGREAHYGSEEHRGAAVHLGINQFINLTRFSADVNVEASNLCLNHNYFYYFVQVIRVDTAGDKRTRIDKATATTYFEICTVGGTSTGSGTWITDTNINT